MNFNIEKYQDFIQQTKKPFYLYDGDIIQQKYQLLAENLPSVVDVFFSMKANPNINFIKLLYNQGAGIEIASKGELIAALRMGVHPSRIVFAGPAKSLEGLELAVEKNILAINVESITELKRVEEICQKLNKEQVVNLRVNPKFKIDNAILQMGGGAMKFGIDEEQLSTHLDVFENLSFAKIDGIHVFAATQILEEELLKTYFENVFDLAASIEEKLNLSLQTIDIGSGFGIDYQKNDDTLDMKKLGRMLSEVFENNHRFTNREDFTLILESGRYLAAESGIYVTEVIDYKSSRNKNFALVKGGINHLLRPALIEQAHKIYSFNENDSQERVSIGGQLCTGVDFFAKDLLMNKLSIGDTLCILDTGAYGYTESMLYFLSHDFPAEYLAYKNDIQQIRKAKTAKEVIEEQIDIGL